MTDRGRVYLFVLIADVICVILRLVTSCLPGLMVMSASGYHSFMCYHAKNLICSFSVSVFGFISVLCFISSKLKSIFRWVKFFKERLDPKQFVKNFIYHYFCLYIFIFLKTTFGGHESSSLFFFTYGHV